MAFKTWKNQYIDLVEADHPLILSCPDEAAAGRTHDILRQKQGGYTQCFLEIGSGSGGHLIGQASRNPAGLYIGFELRFKRTYKTAEKAERQGIHNLLVVRGNAEAIDTFFDPQSLDGIFVNFPDPWAKRRWKKHRLLNADYLRRLHSILKPGGFFSYKTDHAEYFRETEHILRQMEGFELNKSLENPHRCTTEQPYIYTEFEKLFISKNQPTYFLLSIKK